MYANGETTFSSSDGGTTSRALTSKGTDAGGSTLHANGDETTFVNIEGHILMCGGLDGLDLATFLAPVPEVFEFPELIFPGTNNGMLQQTPPPTPNTDVAQFHFSNDVAMVLPTATLTLEENL
jgi:hypothetical protein